MSQYYIARIRYQNPLPPPPFPPKLLDIPTPIDPYTTPEYTSTLAQSQPANIDIDVEGGMPLDLSIIPGLFEGDESGSLQIYEAQELISRLICGSNAFRPPSSRSGVVENTRNSHHPLPLAFPYCCPFPSPHRIYCR